MILDLGESTDHKLPEYDVCVIGSGPAGITVVNELSGAGLRLCVLESGRLQPTPLGDRLRDVRSEGIAIRPSSRERVFGGASTTWTAGSAPLDTIDLAPRPWLRFSGWPIEEHELRRFYQEAAARYRFPPLEYFGPHGFEMLRRGGVYQPEWKDVDEKIFLAAREPPNFARVFRQLFEGRDVDLYLDATAVGLTAGPNTDVIDRVVVRTRDSREVSVHARLFVLATGGLENPRLLLASRDSCPDGLGNESDQVGRFLMNHPKNYYGTLRLDRPGRALDYYLGAPYQDFSGYAGLRLREETQRDRGLLNSYARLEVLYPWSASAGLPALVELRRRIRGRAGTQTRGPDLSDAIDARPSPSSSGWARLALDVFSDAPRLSRYAYARFIRRSRPEVRAIRVRNFMEMEPDPNNRVVLGPDRDEFGVPIPIVRHRCTDLDRRSLVELHRSLRTECAATGLGELQTDIAAADPWPIDLDASHHMGTTRMGDDRATSVVDPTLRVHGVPNLYVAGSSVFPTSGCAHPTFTIVALAIRLARHLRHEVLQRERDAASS